MSSTSYTSTIMGDITALAEGHQGAAEVLHQLVKHTPLIYPLLAAQGRGILEVLGDYQLCGSDLWVLYKDLCGQDLVRLLAVVAALGTGDLEMTDLRDGLRLGGSAGRIIVNARWLVTVIKAKQLSFDNGRRIVKGTGAGEQRE